MQIFGEGEWRKKKKKSPQEASVGDKKHLLVVAASVAEAMAPEVEEAVTMAGSGLCGVSVENCGSVGRMGKRR